jgi:hypothetical protein
MLAKARKAVDGYEFEQADIGARKPDCAPDVIY